MAAWQDGAWAFFEPMPGWFVLSFWTRLPFVSGTGRTG
ncbi:MAG: DUF2793 domain-containing protein [Mesorhizobium sp.]